MIIPIRCFTCNKPIAHLWKDYENAIQNGHPAKDVFEILNIKRYCCRRMFIGNVNIIDKLVMYPTDNKF
jgi:DNA-directed RNA polymerase subunit N (RpoN/RPB10)